jgi:hypothetical protein
MKLTIRATAILLMAIALPIAAAATDPMERVEECNVWREDPANQSKFTVTDQDEKNFRLDQYSLENQDDYVPTPIEVAQQHYDLLQKANDTWHGFFIMQLLSNDQITLKEMEENGITVKGVCVAMNKARARGQASQEE